MAIIATVGIDLDKIDESKAYKGKKGRYLNLDITINDDVKFDNNVSISVGQSKIERDAKQPKTYLGNGQVKWHNDKMPEIIKANAKGDSAAEF